MDTGSCIACKDGNWGVDCSKGTYRQCVATTFYYTQNHFDYNICVQKCCTVVFMNDVTTHV